MILPTPPCVPSDANKAVFDFVIAPNGEIFHKCHHGPWYDSTGTEVTAHDLEAVAGDGTGLAREDSGLCVVDFETQECTLVTALEGLDLLAARVTSGGYWVATMSKKEMARWHGSPEADAVKEVVFATQPTDPTLFDGPQLDFAGNFYAFGEIDSDHVIVRFPADGSAGEIVYTEADDPVVKIDPDSDVFSSFLVTGP
jgi:hypothetical protein